MSAISEKEFQRLCEGIKNDRDTIIKHNPIGSDRETLLWMLLSVLISYLSLDEKEIPCFPGETNENTYLQAIEMIIENRRLKPFESGPIIEEMLAT